MENRAPRLRTDLEYIPVDYEGSKALLVKDPLGLFPEPVILMGGALEVLGLLDGTRSRLDIQVELVRRRGGALVRLEDIDTILRELEAGLILEGERYAREKARIMAEFMRLDARPAAHAGRAYPGEVEELRASLKRILTLDRQPSREPPQGRVTAIVAPHIDLEVGRHAYGCAYGALQGLRPGRVLLLGTGHALDESLLALTEKDFETPLGRVRTDKECVRKLKALGGEAVAASDFAHKTEHSLEFQLLFLQQLLGSGFLLVPVLCGSWNRFLNMVDRPSEIPDMASMIPAFKDLAADPSAGTLLVAGVDFSHVGPKFGHDRPAAALLEEARRHDRRLIDALCSQDVEAFWREAGRVDDRYNVCGLSTLALLLEILPGGQGRLLDYDLWQEEPTRSAVSFAALAFVTP